MQRQLFDIQEIAFDDFFIDVLQHIVRIAFQQSVLDQVFDAPADTAQSVDEVDRDVFVNHVEHFVQQFFRVFAEVGFAGDVCYCPKNATPPIFPLSNPALGRNGS